MMMMSAPTLCFVLVDDGKSGGFAARWGHDVNHHTRDGGRNQTTHAFSSVSSVLSSNKSASSSSGARQTTTVMMRTRTTQREKKKSKNEDYSGEKKEHPKHPLFLCDEQNRKHSKRVIRGSSSIRSNHILHDHPRSRCVFERARVDVDSAGGVSDYLDGYLARRWNQTSNFGSFFDAAADKIFVSSVGVGMAATGQLPAWIVGLFVLRDCGFLAAGFGGEQRSSLKI